MNWQVNKRVLAGLTTGLLLAIVAVNTAQAWYPSHPYRYPNTYQLYSPYYSGPYPNYWYGTRGPRFSGYTQPRWYMRGRMNRYGDYRVDVKVRDISMYDIYLAWLLFNGYGY